MSGLVWCCVMWQGCAHCVWVGGQMCKCVSGVGRCVSVLVVWCGVALCGGVVYIVCGWEGRCVSV